MTRLRLSVPGKVMIAGEYSVLRPGGLALAIAVDPGVELEAEPAERACIERSDTGERWRDGEPVPDGLVFVHAAVTAVSPRQPLLVRTWTPAEVGSGDSKPGFGGSASATVGAVAAAWWADGYDGGVSELIQVAHEVHRARQGGRGSGYDVATIVHGGATAWEVRELEGGGVRSGTASAVPLASGLGFLAGYAGRSASTTGLLARVAARLGGELGAALDALGRPVSWLVAALSSPDRTELRLATIACREALVAFDGRAGGGLVTPELASLMASADALGVPCKVSGAGGGDSVVAYDVDADRLAQLGRVWAAEGRRVLPLQISVGAHANLRAAGPREKTASVARLVVDGPGGSQ